MISQETILDPVNSGPGGRGLCRDYAGLPGPARAGCRSSQATKAARRSVRARCTGPWSGAAAALPPAVTVTVARSESIDFCTTRKSESDFVAAWGFAGDCVRTGGNLTVICSSFSSAGAPGLSRDPKFRLLWSLLLVRCSRNGPSIAMVCCSYKAARRGMLLLNMVMLIFSIVFLGVGAVSLGYGKARCDFGSETRL